MLWNYDILHNWKGKVCVFGRTNEDYKVFNFFEVSVQIFLCLGLSVICLNHRILAYVDPLSTCPNPTVHNK